MTFKDYEYKINMSDVDGSCNYCEMFDNCKQTYGECRQYNPVWKSIDKQITNIRLDIFKQIVLINTKKSNQKEVY